MQPPLSRPIRPYSAHGIIACFHRSWDLAHHFAFQDPSLGHLPPWIPPVCFTRRETSKRYWRPPCLASHTTPDTNHTNGFMTHRNFCVLIWKTVCHKKDGTRPRIKRARLRQWNDLPILPNPSIQIANGHNWISGPGESGVTGGLWYCGLKNDSRMIQACSDQLVLGVFVYI